MNTQTTKLTINTDNLTPSSPYLFGHNLEHTRACVSGGLSAQLLRNRKFAGRPSRRLGVSAEWFGIGERAFFRNDSRPYVRHHTPNGMWRRNETNSQTVQNVRAGDIAGIGQRDIDLVQGKKYIFAVVAACSGPVTMHAALTDNSGETVYAKAAIELSAGDFARYEAELVCSADDAAGCLRMTFDERAEVIFGAVSLLPADNFHGMRPDVVRQLKRLGVGILRWPGGNFAGEYRWQDMLLPVDMRAPLQAYTEDETQPYTHGYDNHELDTDDFIALCREIGAEPFITVNLAWDSPEQCAAWVEYCNGAPDTPYGRLRAERGNTAPYDVRYWSLGNEMGYGHMEGPMQPARYAELGRAAAEAMLSVSPELNICGSGLYQDPDKAPDWIEDSAKALAPAATYISFHTYNNFEHNYIDDAAIRRAYDTVLASVDQNVANIRALRVITPADIHISYDEWNLWAAWFRRGNALEGMYVASMLHAMLYTGPECDVPILCYFQPVGEGAIDVYPHSAELSANGQAFELIKAHKGAELCAIDGIDSYEAVASIKDGALTLTVINTDYDASRRYQIGGCGRRRLAEARLLAAAELLPGSRFVESALDVKAAADGIAFEMPPRSVLLVRMV